MGSESHISVANLLGHQNDTVSWIVSQPDSAQIGHAAKGLDLLLGEAGQPKSTSGNACVRLCGFVEQCSKSQSPPLREWAFSRGVTEKLFTFYVEWNESDQHRSMKLVLDLIVQLCKKNPNTEVAAETEKNLLKTLISIVIGTSTKPVVKSAIKIIDHFLTKNIFNLDDLRLTYIRCQPQADSSDEIEVWRKFFAEILQWMRIHFVCPTAGKFIVLLYRGLRSRQTELPVEMWHQWLLNFLAEEPGLLEAVKNYIFVPLFKSDRTEALRFLRGINNHEVITTTQDLEMDISTLLQLAALETGKRVGLVEEPALSTESKAGDESSPLVLHEKILTSVLSHPAHEVRSLAFSLLITSPSTTRPYSSTALDLLQKHLGTYFADPDAKFRVDVMSKARDMFKRVRGSICVLKRSIPRARAKARQRQNPTGPTKDAGSGAASTTTQPIMYHTNLISLPESQLVQCLDHHVAFLRWYVRFLCGELTPTASYQRHVGSLKALSQILRMEGETSKPWETSDDQELLFDLFDETWVRALFDLIMDPFDDVREMSSACLRSILGSQRYRRFTLKVVERGESLEDLLTRSNELARRTARADHSDGAARAAQLVYKYSDDQEKRLSFLTRLIDGVEGKLSVAENDLGRAVLDAPVQGDFAALRYIWQVAAEIKFGEQELESLQMLQARLVDYCERIWVAVRDILCDDSPEGHLPQELEEVDGLNTRDVLSYSFRSIHESSNLMRTLVLTIRNRSKLGLITPSASLFARIGNLSFDQLSNLRHRGAFTTVSTTFATCCQQAKHLEHGDTTNGEIILNTWYKGTMEAIYGQASTTRRSAGIPSLMTGLLSANAAQPSFEEVMGKLIEISSTEARVRETDGSNLPQVHAFNCLKDIFKNSLLTSMGNKAEKYLPQCLELAANALKSEVWAIRNCGLILLRSLLDTLFGSQESKSMIEAGWDGKANRIPYYRYPTLPSVLLNLLKSGHQMMSPTAMDTAGAESVFPSLDIVRRAGPPDLLREELQIHIAKYLASPVWHVREMAARALCSCLLHGGWLQAIKGLLQDSLQDQTRNASNHVHGVLLALKFVFDRLSEVSLDHLTGGLAELISTLKETNIAYRYAYCPDVLSAYLEVVNQISLYSVLHSIPSEKIEVSIPSVCGGALLKIQAATYLIHTSYRSASPIEGLRCVFLGGRLGDDTMAAALELIPRLWNTSTTPDDVLVALCDFYIDICLETVKSEPQALALEAVADILDHLLAVKNYEGLGTLRLSALWSALPFRPVNPSLSNAILRASGSMVATLLHFGQISATGLGAWGLMMADGGLEDQSFDTRFAAAESLRSFFAATTNSCTSDEHLPALLSLYDALNDDDDEVRDVGSAAVKSILGLALVPIEAANRLLEWLASTFADSTAFKSIITTRLVGARNPDARWQPAEEQLSAALRVDDSLFVVEEQNLFIDEVREVKRWVSVYEATRWDTSDSLVEDLDAWLCRGLARLQRLLKLDDGPLGWASNPQVFAVCSVLIRCSVAMASNGHASSSLQGSIRQVKEVLDSNQTKHTSGLLTEPLEEVQMN